MKKTIIFILILFLIAILAVETTVIVMSKQEKKPEQSTESTNQSDLTESTITRNHKEGTYTEGKVTKTYLSPKNNELVYTYIDAIIDEAKDSLGRGVYKVPQINLNSEYVKDVNEEISEDFETVLYSYNSDKQLYSVAESAKYFYALNDGILSLVIESLTDNDNYKTYLIFNINTSAGIKVPNEELLNKYHMTISDLKDALKRELNKLASSANESKKEQIQKVIDSYTNNKAITEYELYIDEDATLCMNVRVSGTEKEKPFSTIIKISE